jgi:long-chain fatty acid transport protein
MAKMTRHWLLVAIGASLAVISPAFGGGIEVPMQSGAAAGQADAFTAQADDASAIFYNPAGLTQLHGTNISAGAYLLQPEFHFDGVNGTSNQRMNLPSVLPHLYAESDFGFDRWRFGLGINNVFGINEDWGRTGVLSTLVNEAQLSVINLAPTAAYKIDDHLSVGMAFNVYYGDLLLTKNVVVAAPPVPDAQFHYRGDAYAFGVTPSVMWKINDRNSFGAYYRSPFSLDFDGHASLAVPGPALIGPSRTKASLSFPQSVGFGYAYRPIQPLKLEADVIWTDWHAVKQLTFVSSDPHFNGQTLPAHWDSGFTYRVGAEYQLCEDWKLRAGYAYSENAVPTATFSPIVPDSNYHLFALGIGYSTHCWGVDVAGNYIYRERHHVSDDVNSPAVDGEWSNNMFGLMTTFTLKF